MYKVVQFHLRISYDDYLLVYQGHAKSIITTATDGRKVEFPAEVVKPYLTRNGILGFFEIVFTQRNKFQSIKKLA